MGAVNKVILVGNVGKDPEIRRTQEGKAVATFTLATNETWRDKAGEKQERTEWHRVVTFQDGLVEIIERLVKKGTQIYLEGQLQTRKWEKDGVDHYTTEVVIGMRGVIQLLGAREDAPEPQRAPARAPSNKRIF